MGRLRILWREVERCHCNLDSESAVGPTNSLLSLPFSSAALNFLSFFSCVSLWDPLVPVSDSSLISRGRKLASKNHLAWFYKRVAPGGEEGQSYVLSLDNYECFLGFLFVDWFSFILSFFSLWLFDSFDKVCEHALYICSSWCNI